MSENTIIGAPFDRNRRLKSILADRREPVVSDDADQIASRLFKIRAAHSSGQRSSANILIDRMYSWRGYQTESGAL